MADWQLTMLALAAGLAAFFAVLAMLDRNGLRAWLSRWGRRH